MTTESEQLLAEALKRKRLNESFSPTDLGAKIGLNKAQAELAARSLSNAGILVLGFDFAAHFSSDFRKSRSPELKAAPGKRRKKMAMKAARA